MKMVGKPGLPKCEHPSSGLLPFYLNGSLEGAEEADVRAHVDNCPACSKELDLLSLVARGLENRDLPVLDEPAKGWKGRDFGWSRTLAAALALPAAAGIWWCLSGFPGAGGVVGFPATGAHEALFRPSQSGTRTKADGRTTTPLDPAESLAEPATIWELGGTTRASGSIPDFRLSRGAATIVVRYPVPVNPDARHRVELVGPDGSVLARQESEPILNTMARATTAFRARLFERAGEYRIVVIQSVDGEEPRRYETAFKVVD